jgi:hypothetical protein
MKLFTKYFKLTFFGWSAKNASHNNFWTNIQIYLNQAPCIGCLQTTKAKRSTEGNCVTAKYRLFQKKSFQHFQAVTYLH